MGAIVDRVARSNILPINAGMTLLVNDGMCYLI